MSYSPSPAQGGRLQTIREVLEIGFPRLYSSEEALASTSTRNLGAPLSPTPIGLRSKRLHEGIEDEDQSGHPLYRELVGWQGSLPGYFLMHLPASARLKRVKASDNLPLFLSDYIQRRKSLALQIPNGNQFAPPRRTLMLFGRADATDGRIAVETMANLRDVHGPQGQLIAACASAVAGNAEKFTDTLRFLTSTSATAPTIHPGSEEVIASEYLCVNPKLRRAGLRHSTLEAHLTRYEAVDFFRLSAIQATHIQPICEPLNPNFPLSAVVQFAQEQCELVPLVCQGRGNPAWCHSDHCCGKAHKFPMPFTTSGRPIGVDGDLALQLINQAKVTRVPSRRPLDRAEMVTVSLFLYNVWGVALAADATFITVTGVNEELLFVRHRATQTLLLSQVLTVHRDPILTNTPHLSVHVGEAVCAHDDALARATALELHRRAGTLPASFRYPFKNEIDLLHSDVPFKELSLSYELSIGRFLPPDLFWPEYTYKYNKELLHGATTLRIHWDADDASMLHFILGDFKSPMTLSSVRASSSRTASVVDVKIHCFKQHSQRVFLCHFIDANKKPYGRPMVMKLAWAPDRRGDYKEVTESGRIVTTLEIDHEFAILEQLAVSDPDVACRVPKPYERFAGDVQINAVGYKFSAYLMEDCRGCYPIGIADGINSDLLTSIDTWLGSVHDREHLLHGSLSVENILFNPSDPTCFYVVGWQKASRGFHMGEVARFERVQQERQSLQSMFVRKDPNRGLPPPNKREKLEGDEDDEDEEDEDEDDGVFENNEDQDSQEASFHGENNTYM